MTNNRHQILKKYSEHNVDKLSMVAGRNKKGKTGKEKNEITKK